ncbi:MAG: ParD-like family protein [Verrucomicrobiales bacterium]|nr:ParD-like family protein [Verrucomicrobiales bacterium]
MSQSVRVSDELIEEAKRQAKLHHRSPPQQIDHWAAIGRVMEVALAYPAQEKVARTVAAKQLDKALALFGTKKGRKMAQEVINKSKNHRLK